MSSKAIKCYKNPKQRIVKYANIIRVFIKQVGTRFSTTGCEEIIVVQTERHNDF